MSEPLSIPFSEGLCYLHNTHVPKPAELHRHHVYPLWMQSEVGEVEDGGEIVLTCPTGHNNIHSVLGRLLKGEKPKGRRGITGTLALRAYEWYKENGGRREGDNSGASGGDVRRPTEAS